MRRAVQQDEVNVIQAEVLEVTEEIGSGLNTGIRQSCGPGEEEGGGIRNRSSVRLTHPFHTHTHP